LDCLETQSTTAFRNVGREERRRIKKGVGGYRERGRIVFIGRGNYNRSMGCQGSHQSNEGHGYRLCFSEDEHYF